MFGKSVQNGDTIVVKLWWKSYSNMVTYRVKNGKLRLVMDMPCERHNPIVYNLMGATPRLFGAICSQMVDRARDERAALGIYRIDRNAGSLKLIRLYGGNYSPKWYPV